MTNQIVIHHVSLVRLCTMKINCDQPLDDLIQFSFYMSVVCHNSSFSEIILGGKKLKCDSVSSLACAGYIGFVFQHSNVPCLLCFVQKYYFDLVLHCFPH
jgi:hypothetical protein